MGLKLYITEITSNSIKCYNTIITKCVCNLLRNSHRYVQAHLFQKFLKTASHISTLCFSNLLKYTYYTYLYEVLWLNYIFLFSDGTINHNFIISNTIITYVRDMYSTRNPMTQTMPFVQIICLQAFLSQMQYGSTNASRLWKWYIWGQQLKGRPYFNFLIKCLP